MRIAIMGSGGVGGYYGALLAQSGNDVTFIARGAHLEAMKKNGLQVKSEMGDLHIQAVQATDDPSEIAPVDVVLFATKLYGTEAAARQIKPIVGPDTMVVTVQNGVTSPDMLSAELGAGHVLGGSTYIISHLHEPGIIEHMGPFKQIQFGELDGKVTDRAKAFEAVCTEAGIDVVLSENILVLMWRKFIPLAVMSGLASAARSPMGVIASDPDLSAMARDAIAEVVAVGRAKGIPLDDDTEEKAFAGATAAPPGTKPSMLVDLERGKPLELPWLSGTVDKMGRELGVPTPVHHFITTVLKPFVDGAPTA